MTGIATPPTAPSRDQTPEAFDASVDDYLEWIEDDFVPGVNALAVAGAFAAEKWVSGTTYAEGVLTWSPIDYGVYRRIIAGAGTTDPSADSTNWAPISGATAATMQASALGPDVVMINGKIEHSRIGNAETITIKTRAGNTPSAADPVLFIFRSATATTGDYSLVKATGALSITINNTATMGATNSIPFRLWLAIFNDAGTLRLGVINCLSGTSIYPLKGWGIASSTAMGTGADNAHVFYTDSAVTSKAYRVIGYSTWEAGLAAVGVWGTAPSRTQLYGPGEPLPGDVVQVARSVDTTATTVTTALPNDNTIPQNTEGGQVMAQAITPTSTANLLDIAAAVYGAHSANAAWSAALFQDSTADALRANKTPQGGAAGAANTIPLRHTMLAATTSATTFKVRAGGATASTLTFNGEGGAGNFGGKVESRLEITEIMA